MAVRGGGGQVAVMKDNLFLPPSLCGDDNNDDGKRKWQQ